MYGGYSAPPDATALVANRTPMFGADMGPRYTGPFNLPMGQQGGIGAMLQMMMPAVLGPMMAPDRMPAQFMPEQNLWDQMEANKFYAANQQAMQISSRPDTEAIENLLGGMQEMMTGRAMTDRERAQNFRMAETTSQYMPMLTQLLGPDLVDRLHGSRGSATVMAQQLHQAMRTSLDPVTGHVGYTGESAGRVSTALFDDLFGDPETLGQMRGMSAGQAGMLAEELQSRGMLGRPMGMLSTEEKLATLPEQLSERVVSRLAEQLPEIRAMMEGDGRPTEAQLTTARESIRATHRTMRGGVSDDGEALTTEDIEMMPGGEEIIRSADAQRIGDRLRNLSGAVKAMRDIFGDMGNPNAPMREIINGLEALTQGGLSTMSPAALEGMVRMTHTLAKQTGIGVQGMMALMSQSAPLADQLGLDRTFAVTGAQHAAAFGAASADVRRMDMPTWGAGTREQLTLADQQLYMHAAASPVANNMAAIMRMRETGMVTPRAGGELEALTNAIERGELEYEFQNAEGDMERREVSINRDRLQGLLEQEGVSRTDSMTILMDRFGNQEYAQRFEVAGTARRLQGREMARQLLAPQMGHRFGSRLMEAGAQEILEAGGITENQGDFRAMMQEIGQGVAMDVVNLTGEQTRDPALRRQTLGNAFRDRLKESVRTRMGEDATDEEVERMTATVIDQMGGEEALTTVGETIYATADAAAVGHPVFGSFVKMVDLLSDETFEQAQKRTRQARATTVMQTAFSSLGTSGPLQRISDAIQGAGPDTTMMEVFQEALGGVDLAEVAAHDPQGVVAEVLGLMEEHRDLDPNDPEQLRRLERNAGMMKALMEGGTLADQELQKMEASRGTIKSADATQAQREEALEELTDVQTRESRLRDAKLTNRGRDIESISEYVAQQEDDQLTDVQKNKARQKGYTAAVKALGDTGEIDLGGGRFLSTKGIDTRDEQGRVITRKGLQNVEVQREAAVALAARQAQDVAAATAEDKEVAAMTVEERTELAEKMGLIKGEYGYGTAEVADALREIRDPASEKSFATVMRKMGAVLGTRVSKADVEAVGDYGAKAKELLGEGTEESREAIDKFVKTSEIRAREILGDKARMEQLGRGGLGLVQDTLESSRELRGLAQQESERLGKDVTVEDVITGADGISEEATEKAKAAFESLQSRKNEGWQEIGRRVATGRMPDEDMEMTERERTSLAEREKFVKRFADEETMAADVADRLIGLGTGEQQDKMMVKETRAELEELLLAGGQTRMEAADRAVRGREGIMAMAVEKGLFQGVEKPEDLTEEQQRQAVGLLEGADLSESDEMDFMRMQQASGGLLDFGLKGLSPVDAVEAMQQEIGAMPGLSTEKEGGDAQEKKMTITLQSGRLTLNDDGTAEIEGEGYGILTPLLQTLGLM
jgi:hypothetical protein